MGAPATRPPSESALSLSGAVALHGVRRVAVRELTWGRAWGRVYGSTGYGQQADVWSLGVVCFALLGGRFPYKQTEPRALVSPGPRACRSTPPWTVR